MAQQTIALGTTANDGTGDTLRAAGGKLNANNSELYGGVQGLMGGRKARIATIGNSHGAVATGIPRSIMRSLWAHYPADVYFDYRTQQGATPTDASAFDPTKGDIFAVGSSNTTQMVSFQLPRLLAAIASGRTYDLLYIADAGYNDQYGTEAAVAMGVANVITTANAALAAGVKLVVIIGIIPASAGSSTFELASWCMEANQRLRIYAANTPGVAFQEVTSLFADMNNPLTGLNKRYGNVYLGYTSDGVHLAGYGARLLAPELVKYHQAIARRRIPRNFGNQGTFGQSTLYSVNVLGNAGNVQGTAGLKQSSFNTGVAGIDANSRLQVIDNTGLTTTPTIVAGADGFNRQRMSVSSAGVNTSLQFNALTGGISNLNNSVLTRSYDFEATIELTGVTGLCDFFVKPNAAASAITPGFGGYAVSNLWPDTTTESWFVYSTVPETYAANTASPELDFFFYFYSDRPAAGTIDVSRISFQRVTD